MPLVNVMVNSRAYTIACDTGEEEHLKELAAHVDAKVRELTGSIGQVGDQKLMLMAAVTFTVGGRLTRPGGAMQSRHGAAPIRRRATSPASSLLSSARGTRSPSPPSSPPSAKAWRASTAS